MVLCLMCVRRLVCLVSARWSILCVVLYVCVFRFLRSMCVPLSKTCVPYTETQILEGFGTHVW